MPVYRVSLALVFGCYLWATTCYFWSRARVNYLFLFELRDEEVRTSSCSSAWRNDQNQLRSISPPIVAWLGPNILHTRSLSQVLGVYESLILGTQQLTLVLVSLLLYSKAILSELPPRINAGIFPSVLFILILSSILFPWRRGSRLIEALRQVFSSPLVPVTLWTSFIGDILTSLVKPLVDLVYSACYILTLEWMTANDQQGRCVTPRLS